MSKSRKMVSLLASRLSEQQPLIQVVLGPRQVGKTTAIKEVVGDTGFYETADYPVPLAAEIIEQWWQSAKDSKARLLAIDEIQKIPGWSEVLKRLWDRESGLKVVVSGSSSLLLEKGLRETLAGRYELIRAEHWNFAEAESIFGLGIEEFIEFGCYPGSVRFLKQTRRWAEYIRESIIEPVLGRDLLQLHPVDNPALLRQVFGVAASLPAQVVSLQKILGKLQTRGSLPTISHYLKLLSDAFLVTGIHKYSNSAFRAKNSSPKLFVHDNALIRSLERPDNKTLSAEERGRYFENAIGARFIEAGWECYYWNHRHHEVDLVVLGPDGERYAVEVKSALASEKDLTGLRTFCAQHPDFEPCLISLPGQKLDGVRLLDAGQILKMARLYD